MEEKLTGSGIDSDVKNEVKSESEFQYVGFWARVLAALVDSVLILLASAPLLWLAYGKDYFAIGGPRGGLMDILVSWLFPAIAVVAFWCYKSATPGKMAIGAKIIDARTGGKPSFRQLIVRYLGYYVSTIPLCLGLLWVAIDKRKQGWHDKLAGTLVVYEEDPGCL